MATHLARAPQKSYSSNTSLSNPPSVPATGAETLAVCSPTGSDPTGTLESCIAAVGESSRWSLNMAVGGVFAQRP